MSTEKEDASDYSFDQFASQHRVIDPVVRMAPCYPAFTYDRGPTPLSVVPSGDDVDTIPRPSLPSSRFDDTTRDPEANFSGYDEMVNWIYAFFDRGDVPMAAESNRSRELQALAQAVLRDLLGYDYSDRRCAAFATSLVEQWLAFDGNATILTDRVQFYVNLGSDREKPSEVGVMPVSVEQCFRRWKHDWELDDDQLNDMIVQLNFGQDALVENRSGRQLRAWVDPKHRSKGIEPIDSDESEEPKRRNYRKLALGALAQVFGEEMPAPLDGDFAIALVRQWVTCDGHGMILTPDSQVFIALKPGPDGGNVVEIAKRPSTIGESLGARGLTVDDVIDILYRLNSGHTPEFTDSEGQHWRLVADPTKGQVDLEPIDALSN